MTTHDPHQRNKWRDQEAKLAAWVAFAAVIAFGVYFVFFLARHYVPGDPDSWGDFGSYFSGVLSPIIGIVTVVLVVRTLEATRNEADMTRAEMKAQTTHFQRVQQLSELQKRLDGALAAWNLLLEQKRPSLRESILGHVYQVPETVGEILRHPETIDRLQHLKEASVWNAIFNNWSLLLNEEINLLKELGDYCAEYEAVAGSTTLTDFYRRRVNLPLRAFNVAGVLPTGTWDRLHIGRQSIPQTKKPAP